jgi:hypothetical protein
MTLVPPFESAWSVKAEGTLSVPDYARRKLVVRRQKIVHIAKSIGWHFLKVGEPIPTSSCLLVGISLTSRRDLAFLDLLRAHDEAWAARPVFLFHIEKPYVLPLSFPPSKTPLFAEFSDNKLVRRHEGDAAFRAVLR